MKDKPAIMIIDDQVESIELLAANLAPQGYEIIRAATGEEALGKLAGDQIDLILLDVVMPGMDGLEVARRIRQDDAGGRIPIIMVTMLQETESRIKGIEAGCDDFITKPFDKTELLARVRSLLKVKAYNDLMNDYRNELESELAKRTGELHDALENLRQDITNRKRAELTVQTQTEELQEVNEKMLATGENLRQSEERYRLLFEQARDSIMLLELPADGPPIIRDANAATLHMHGYTRGEIIGQPVSMLDAETDFVPLDRERRSRTHAPGGGIFDVRHRRKDGTVIDVESSARELTVDETRCSLVIERDITERKRSQEELMVANEGMRQRMEELERSKAALGVSEASYRRLFEAAKDGILILNAGTGVIEDANPFIKELLGYPSEELIGKELWEIGLFRDIAASRDSFMELQNKGYVRYEDLPLQTKDGIKKEVEFVSNVYPVGDHSVVQCNIRDITERRQAERNIQRERAYFDQLVKTAPESITISDTQGRLMKVNAEFTRMFGYEADEAIGRNMDDLVAFPERQKEARELTITTNQGKTSVLETVRRRKDGSLIDVSLITAPIIIAGEQEAGYGIYRDITDSKRADKALRDSERQWQGTFNAITDIVTVLSKDHVFLNVNEATVKALGLPREQIIGRKCYELVHRTTAPITACPCGKALETGRPEISECEQDGRIYDLHAWPIKDAAGNDSSFVHIVKEISDQKRAEEKIKQQLAELLRWQSTMLDREDRVQELKREINGLLAKTGQPPKYGGG